VKQNKQQQIINKYTKPTYSTHTHTHIASVPVLKSIPNRRRKNNNKHQKAEITSTKNSTKITANKQIKEN